VMRLETAGAVAFTGAAIAAALFLLITIWGWLLRRPSACLGALPTPIPSPICAPHPRPCTAGSPRRQSCCHTVVLQSSCGLIQKRDLALHTQPRFRVGNQLRRKANSLKKGRHRHPGPFEARDS
jgi:hypothetical protein